MKAILKMIGASMVAAIVLAGTANAGWDLGVFDKNGFDALTDSRVVEEGFSFETIKTAIEAAGLKDTVKGFSNTLIFAPTDRAFAKLPEGALQDLLKDKEQLTKVLLKHIAKNPAFRLTPSQLYYKTQNGPFGLLMFSGETLSLTQEQFRRPGDHTEYTKILIEDSTILLPAIKADNGVVIYGIDTLL